MTSTMTRDQAQALRAAHDTDARLLSRKTRHELLAIATSERAAAGYERLFGQSSKDELVSEILELRGFGIERLNEATHILHHDPRWPDCPRCQAEIAAVARTKARGRNAAAKGEDGLTEYIPTGTGWPAL